MKPPLQTERATADSEVRRYFALTFLWTWTFWGLAAVGRVEWPAPAALLLFAVGGIGPALAASVLTARGHATERLSEFWLRVVDPRRIPPIWYLAILGAAVGPPLLGALATGGGVGIGPGAAALATFVVGVLAGLAEEPGWRGYALDRLQAGRSALAASLILGAVWALWHLPLFFILGTYHHGLGVGTWQFWLFFVAVVPGSVLATWVYNNTRRAILAAVLLHAVGNAAHEQAPMGDAGKVVAFVATLALAALVTVIWGARTLAGPPMGEQVAARTQRVKH